MQPAKKRLRLKTTPVSKPSNSLSLVAGYLQITGRSNQTMDRRYPIDAPLHNALMEYANSLGLTLNQVHFTTKVAGDCRIVDGGATMKDLGIAGPQLLVIEAVNHIDHLRDRVGAAISKHLVQNEMESSMLFGQLCEASPGAQKVGF